MQFKERNINLYNDDENDKNINFAAGCCCCCCAISTIIEIEEK